ncbi:MAG: DinB family protein [Cyanobacteria bacterium TGS_CYA1]|nr:DinB family protein [Cyanobacteria bacterium TGS_CYA1]
MTIISEPKLAKPGAGLPLIEWLVAKYIIFPNRFRSTTIEQSLKEFEAEAQRIIELASGLSDEQLSKRCLIPRLQGLEDSSRYWSVAMTIEHLNIVGEGMLAIIVSLSRNNNQLPKVGTADVKPLVDVAPQETVEKFKKLVENFGRLTRKIDFDKYTDSKHSHPWFGPLNAREWTLFAAPHQQIHRKQIEAIIARLK